jgi:YVTN family beta-propeller protein
MRTARYALCAAFLAATAMVPAAASAAGTSPHVVTTIPVCSHPIGVAVNTTTDMIYVPCDGDDSVSVIDGQTGTVTATINLGSPSWQAAVNPNTDLVYVSDSGGRSVVVINGQTN